MQSTADSLWRKMITELGKDTKEIKTINSAGHNDRGKWFSVKVVDDILYVDAARENSPSSSLMMARPISKKGFITLYANYSKWRAGTMTRVQASGNSMNSSYIFALIHAFDDN